jgi:hypothetical protein
VLLDCPRKPTIFAGICRRLPDKINQKRIQIFKILKYSKQITLSKKRYFLLRTSGVCSPEVHEWICGIHSRYAPLDYGKTEIIPKPR